MDGFFIKGVLVYRIKIFFSTIFWSIKNHCIARYPLPAARSISILCESVMIPIPFWSGVRSFEILSFCTVSFFFTFFIFFVKYINDSIVEEEQYWRERDAQWFSQWVYVGMVLGNKIGILNDYQRSIYCYEVSMEFLLSRQLYCKNISFLFREMIFYDENIR